MTALARRFRGVGWVHWDLINEPSYAPRSKLWFTRPIGDAHEAAAWKAWVQKHQAAIVDMGGPLGKTKKITQSGIADVNNEMGGFTVIRAESQEAAAKLFENHPHFAIFPGESVEVMPVLPIPGA